MATLYTRFRGILQRAFRDVSISDPQDGDTLVYNASTSLWENGPAATLNEAGEIVGTIILRNDTAANLAAVVPAEGEPAWSTDTEKLVIGDGATAFASLPAYGKIEVDTAIASIESPIQDTRYTARTNSLATIFNCPASAGVKIELLINDDFGASLTLNDSDEFMNPHGPTNNTSGDIISQSGNSLVSDPGVWAYFAAISADLGSGVYGWIVVEMKNFSFAV